MGHITNGEIRYGENIKTGDYAGKKAEAVFAFKSDDSDDALAQAGKALALAIAHVNQALGLKNTTALTTAPKAETAAPAAAGKEAVAAKEAAKAKKAAEKAETKRAEAPKKPAAADEVPDEEELPAAAGGVEDIEDEVVAITDATLADAIAKKNQEVQNPQAIRVLIAEFAGNEPPVHSRKIPADKRQEFLNKLAKVPKQAK